MKYKVVTTQGVCLEYTADKEIDLAQVAHLQCINISGNYIMVRGISYLVKVDEEEKTHTVMLSNNDNIPIALRRDIKSKEWHNEFLLLDNALIRSNDIHAIIKN